MRDENGSRTLSSSVGVLTDDAADASGDLDINRSLRSVAHASARVGHLVKQAMMFLESDRRAAQRYLKEASALLGSESHDSASSVPTTSEALQPSGLVRWKAKRALEHIEANLEWKIYVYELANLVGLSRSHFARAFKRSLGVSPMAYVATRRVERAKVMMTQTRKGLTEIALACGFADQSHLNRSFIRMVGVSPGRWRRTNPMTSSSAPQQHRWCQKFAQAPEVEQRNPQHEDGDRRLEQTAPAAAAHGHVAAHGDDTGLEGCRFGTPVITTPDHPGRAQHETAKDEYRHALHG